MKILKEFLRALRHYRSVTRALQLLNGTLDLSLVEHLRCARRSHQSLTYILLSTNSVQKCPEAHWTTLKGKKVELDRYLPVAYVDLLETYGVDLKNCLLMQVVVDVQALTVSFGGLGRDSETHPISLSEHELMLLER